MDQKDALSEEAKFFAKGGGPFFKELHLSMIKQNFAKVVFPCINGRRMWIHSIHRETLFGFIFGKLSVAPKIPY